LLNRSSKKEEALSCPDTGSIRAMTVFHQRRPALCPPPGAVIMMAEEKENANIRWKGIT